MVPPASVAVPEIVIEPPDSLAAEEGVSIVTTGFAALETLEELALAEDVDDVDDEPGCVEAEDEPGSEFAEDSAEPDEEAAELIDRLDDVTELADRSVGSGPASSEQATMTEVNRRRMAASKGLTVCMTTPVWGFSG